MIQNHDATATYSYEVVLTATDSSGQTNTQGVLLPVDVVTLPALTLNPASVVGGNSSQATLTLSGAAPAGGSIEWCVNAPVVDANSVVYANSEDGFLYAVNQGGTLKQRTFQQQNLGATYTPASLGADGKIYSQNAGHLFVVGN